MEVLLTFLYTAKTTIDPSNVQMLLEAANLFQIDLLRRVSNGYLNTAVVIGWCEKFYFAFNLRICQC